jgi:alpha-tubulin suppressor-like RCC1 family protein
MIAERGGGTLGRMVRIVRSRRGDACRLNLPGVRAFALVATIAVVALSCAGRPAETRRPSSRPPEVRTAPPTPEPTPSCDMLVVRVVGPDRRPVQGATVTASTEAWEGPEGAFYQEGGQPRDFRTPALTTGADGIARLCSPTELAEEYRDEVNQQSSETRSSHVPYGGFGVPHVGSIQPVLLHVRNRDWPAVLAGARADGSVTEVLVGPPRTIRVRVETACAPGSVRVELHSPSGGGWGRPVGDGLFEFDGIGPWLYNARVRTCAAELSAFVDGRSPERLWRLEHSQTMVRAPDFGGGRVILTTRGPTGREPVSLVQVGTLSAEGTFIVENRFPGYFPACMHVSRGDRCWTNHPWAGQIVEGPLPPDRPIERICGPCLRAVPAGMPRTAAELPDAVSPCSFSKVATGSSHVCALVSDGRVACWGSNSAGQCGGRGHARVRPRPVPGVTDAASLALGSSYSCALLRDGTVACWGNNEHGQLGRGNTDESDGSARPVSALTDVVQVESGSVHSCALTASGTVLCWGGNDYGQLGDGTTTERSLPVEATGLSRVRQISVSGVHSCAVQTNGTVWCWGYDGHAAVTGVPVGRGPFERTPPHHSPAVVRGVRGAEEIAAGSQHTCARLHDGRVQCWGNNGGGLLGAGEQSSGRPVIVRGLRSAVQLALGSAHACARTQDGHVHCWGSNRSGQLGDGTRRLRATPVAVPSVEDAMDIAVGADFTCALRTGGSLSCWGANEHNQVGDGLGGQYDSAQPSPSEVRCE